MYIKKIGLKILKYSILFFIFFWVESVEVKKENGDGVGLLNDDLMLIDESDDEKVSYIVLYYSLYILGIIKLYLVQVFSLEVNQYSYYGSVFL